METRRYEDMSDSVYKLSKSISELSDKWDDISLEEFNNLKIDEIIKLSSWTKIRKNFDMVYNDLIYIYIQKIV